MSRFFDRFRTGDVSGTIVVGDNNIVLQNVSGFERKPYIPGRAEISEGQGELAWLQWQSRLVDPIVGRDKEFEQLIDWVQSNVPVRARLLIGEGGVGKSRLGAELAEHFLKEGWDAGFVSLGSEAAYLPNRAGRLLIVDYPEENLDACRNLLSQLDRLRGKDRTRLLLLSRRDESFWKSPITPVARFFDSDPMCLEPLDLDVSVELFQNARSPASYAIFHGLTNFWAFQYLAWALPLWLVSGWRFALPMSVVTTAYVYALYVWLCDSWLLDGPWDWYGNPHWPLGILLLRNAAILFFLSTALLLILRDLGGELRRLLRLR